MNSNESQGLHPENVLYLIMGGVALSFISLLVFHSTEQPVDVEKERGDRRLEIQKKVFAEELQRSESLEWVNKEKGTVRVPVSAARIAVLSDLSAKKVSASAVKVDPVLSLPPDLPALPSAPSGAVGTRFPSFQPRKE